MKILVIDDEPDLRGLTAKILQSWGCEVVEASGVHQGLEEFDKDPGSFDKVMTDLQMEESETDGLTVAEKIKASRPDLPVYIVSGTLTPQVIMQARQLGVSGCIPKPWDLYDLKSRLQL